MEGTAMKSKKQLKQTKKGQLKKNMKNVLCRPDTIFWPQISDSEKKVLQEILFKYKVEIPDFIKPSWNELKHISKKLRPKPSPIPKVDGLIFGLIQCQKAIESKECVGVLIESTVNPKTIVQPLLELCTNKSIPVLCFKDLRDITKMYFGIPTTVLSVKCNLLPELESKILEISKYHRPPKQDSIAVNVEKGLHSSSIDKQEEMMEVENESLICPYLYRTDNKTRLFTPTANTAPKLSTKFIGQDFIEFSNTLPKENLSSKQYMKMIVKKISSNPNRKKPCKNNSEINNLK